MIHAFSKFHKLHPPRAFLTQVASWLVAGVCLLAVGKAWSQSAISFVDSSLARGLDFKHDDMAGEEGYLVSMMGSGLASFDYDGDRRIDLLFLNGAKLDGSSVAPFGLFRNETNASMVRRTDASQLKSTAFGLGVAIADVDNDGFQDIAVSSFGSASLWRNMGDGTFVDASSTSGISQVSIAFGAGVCFLDANGDGLSDLFLADYVEFTLPRFQIASKSSFPYPPGPGDFPYRPDHLLINRGDGTFVDESEKRGLSAIRSPSMGTICGDLDQDGDSDIFVCSDARPNLLYINDGKGVFTEEALLYGVANAASGEIVGSMGVDAADLDNDGWEDLFITDYSAQVPLLFRNIDGLGFEDIALRSRVGKDLLPHVNWGLGLCDFDNDGDRDLMVGNGHLFAWAKKVEQLTDFKVRNTLMVNDGRGFFQNGTATAGSGMEQVESTRGMAFDDFDNDGDIDAAVLNSDAPASLLENKSSHAGNWLQLELVGTAMNRDALGAQVRVKTNGKWQFAEKRSGRSYQSHYGSRLHFGLGTMDKVEMVEVRWNNGVTQHPSLEANHLHVLVQPTQ
ncbi:FG-GAP repeat protein [Pirellula sp. SH-Sr6A]|uniref:CRTAC1 family protein n=1 Tax=Pirellula sp. SH-Sr6A TaxID=1632865 RepID=UPI00078DBA4F|nr:CRTAC1 family protein [Pirellula sp. SH-Sr6A]AMV32514.1 FG-GAP repeat protein [Pirellula sp. SH-Sr6A]